MLCYYFTIFLALCIIYSPYCITLDLQPLQDVYNAVVAVAQGGRNVYKCFWSGEQFYFIGIPEAWLLSLVGVVAVSYSDDTS